MKSTDHVPAAVPFTMLELITDVRSSWPVMPVEIHQLHIKPVNFFTQNPSLDVPSSKDNVSVLTEGAGFGVCCEAKKLTAASL